MTKTNKTLLCALLALVLTLACALTIMPTVTTVHAAETKIKYLTNPKETTSSNSLSGTTDAIDSSNPENVLKLTIGTKVFPDGTNGLKLGSSKAAGNFSFIVPKNAVSVTVYVKDYNNESKEFTINSESYTISNSFVGYTYPQSGKLSEGETIKLQSAKRTYVQSIEVTFEESISTPVAITINGTSQIDNTVENDDYKLVVEGAGKGLVVGGQYVATLTLKNAVKTAILKANNETIESGNTYDIAEGVTELNFTVDLSENTCTHANKTLVPATESTCITKGNKTAYYHCNDCGLNFSDEEMTTVFTPEELPLAEHTLIVDEDNSVAATCTKAGKEVKKCTTVGCTYSTETVIAALGHNFDENGKCQRNGCDVTLPESMTITPADFSKKSYADNNGTKTIGDISVTINQVMQNNEEKIQFQRDKGYLILNNVTVYSIEIDASLTSNVVVSTYDTEELAKAGKGTAVTANNGVYLLNVANKYVRIAQNSALLTLFEIKVVFRELVVKRD